MLSFIVVCILEVRLLSLKFVVVSFSKRAKSGRGPFLSRLANESNYMRNMPSDGYGGGARPTVHVVQDRIPIFKPHNLLFSVDRVLVIIV
jgi:hypothetical protein